MPNTSLASRIEAVKQAIEAIKEAYEPIDKLNGALDDLTTFVPHEEAHVLHWLHDIYRELPTYNELNDYLEALETFKEELEGKRSPEALKALEDLTESSDEV